MSEKSMLRIFRNQTPTGQLDDGSVTKHKAIILVSYLLNLFLIVNENHRHEYYDTSPNGVPNILEKIRKSYQSLINGLSKDFPSTVYESKISMDGGSLAYQLSVGLRKILQRLRDQNRERLYISSTVGNFTLALQLVCSTMIWTS